MKNISNRHKAIRMCVQQSSILKTRQSKRWTNSSCQLLTMMLKTTLLIAIILVGVSQMGRRSSFNSSFNSTTITNKSRRLLRDRQKQYHHHRQLRQQDEKNHHHQNHRKQVIRRNNKQYYQIRHKLHIQRSRTMHRNIFNGNSMLKENSNVHGNIDIDADLNVLEVDDDDDGRHTKKPEEENKSNPPAPPEYTFHPSMAPSPIPSLQPSLIPSTMPTVHPSSSPTIHITQIPSSHSSSYPTLEPSNTQSLSPTCFNGNSGGETGEEVGFGNTDDTDPVIVSYIYSIETDPKSNASIESDVLPNVEEAIASMLAKSFLGISCGSNGDGSDDNTDSTEISRSRNGEKLNQLRRRRNQSSTGTMLGLSSAPEDKMLPNGTFFHHASK